MKGNRVAYLAALVLLAGCGGEVITPETVTESPSTPSTPTVLPVLQEGATEAVQPTPATLTPTVTPTPIIHIVQSGETLGAIAAQYDVSVEALQLVNGIDNPLLLQVNQELIIPTGEEALVEQPGLLLPTPTPLPIGRQGIGFYETPVGSLWCLGEVVNTTSYTMTNVQVQITLYDGAGTQVAEGDAFAAADILAPLARAPFGILFLSPPTEFTSHQATILRSEPAGQLADGYFVLGVDDVSGAANGPQFEISGTVRNTDGTRLASSVVVVVTTYDEEGLVTGFRQQMIDVGEEGLAPGASIPFSLLMTAHGRPPEDFALFASGRVSTGE